MQNLSLLTHYSLFADSVPIKVQRLQFQQVYSHHNMVTHCWKTEPTTKKVMIVHAVFSKINVYSVGFIECMTRKDGKVWVSRFCSKRKKASFKITFTAVIIQITKKPWNITLLGLQVPIIFIIDESADYFLD